MRPVAWRAAFMAVSFASVPLEVKKDFFMFPGAKDLIHGPGDIEGARVTYEQNDKGEWVPVSAVADNGFHQEVELEPGDFVDAQGRVLLKTHVWSHQLGAKGQHDGDAMTCFTGDSLAPMTFYPGHDGPLALSAVALLRVQ